MPRKLFVVLAVLALSVLSLPALAAAAPPDAQRQASTAGDDRAQQRRVDDEVIDTAPEVHAAHEHPVEASHGHIPGSADQVELIGQENIRGGADGRVADVSAFGNYAYLTVRDPVNCTGDEAAGIAVFDISNPRDPVQVGFINATGGSQPGEGSDVLDLDTEAFTGQLLVFNNELCDETAAQEAGGSGGVTLVDVTDPLNPEYLVTNFGDPDVLAEVPGFGAGFFNDIHSAFAWQDDDRAFTVLVDNFETTDVDMVEITDPRNPVFLADFDLNEESVVQDELLTTGNFQGSFLHDITVKEIDGVQTMLLSYWDGGWVQLNVEDPANPVFIDDFEYPFPDTLLPNVETPEGNAHQAEYSFDDRFIVGTDEDFSPFRLEDDVLSVLDGPNAGDYPGGQFGFTVPISEYPDEEINGPTIYGGLGCPSNAEYGEQPPIPDASNLSAAEGQEKVVVLLRGLCFFSEKIEQAQLAGYDAVIIANHHAGSEFGERPDTSLCGSQGHEFTPTIGAVCTGHRAFHLMFNQEPTYGSPEEPGGDEPEIGTLGPTVRAGSEFDGWGYVRLLNQETMDEIDAYAIPEALDPAFAQGFGDLSVHEVATDPNENLAYFSYYAGGFRVAEFGEDGIREIAHYVSEEGNNFWGVEVHEINGQQYQLLSDRDSGLWIFQHAPCTITGTDGDDMLRGTDRRDVICGMGGDDTIHARGGNDLVFAGAGADMVSGGDGNDVVWGGAGDDHLKGDRGRDELHGEEGDDRLSGGRFRDHLWGGAGNDDVRGGRGNDMLSGGEGDDDVYGDRGNDRLHGDEGDDLLHGSQGDDAHDGGPGVDTCNGAGGRGDTAMNCERLLNIEDDQGTTITTTLTGAEEVDPETGAVGVGDPDGSGTATVTINSTEGSVCFDISVADIMLPATGAHIHEAPAGVAGPVVIPLVPPGADGASSGCVEDVDAELVQDLLRNPANYYVNIHNEEFPAGAVRGQLG